VPTNLEAEMQEQSRWRLRSGMQDTGAFAGLVRAEFISPQQQHDRACSALHKIALHAEERVPYYRELFARLGITARDLRRVEDLARLPRLTRSDVQERAADLHASRLPEGHGVWGDSETSGSTGQPVRITHTLASRAMFTLTKQREMRWFRFDPRGTYAEIRPAREMPLLPDNEPIPDGTACERPEWPMIGRFMQTGPYCGLSHAAPLERQVEWLEQCRPDYLLAQSANLEHLAFAFQGRARPDFLRAVLGISAEMTPAMRDWVQGVFGVPAHENYGLNEFGVVASRCPEGGRLHVHLEHCLVEVVDENDQPCRAGERGHILVSTLLNLATPLLRYETGDLAEAVDGPCPCGRTLPSFGRIHGRYRRIAYLPPGTWTYWTTLQKESLHIPKELLKPIKQYQLHEYRDGHFELNLVAEGPVPDALVARLREIWQSAGGSSPAPLTIRQVDNIPLAPGGKFQSFISDFMPPRDAAGPDASV